MSSIFFFILFIILLDHLYFLFIIKMVNYKNNLILLEICFWDYKYIVGK